MPSSIRRHHWSIASILLVSVFDIIQQSEPYRNTGKMHVLYSFNFVEVASRDLLIWFSINYTVFKIAGIIVATATATAATTTTTGTTAGFVYLTKSTFVSLLWVWLSPAKVSKNLENGGHFTVFTILAEHQEGWEACKTPTHQQ